MITAEQSESITTNGKVSNHNEKQQVTVAEAKKVNFRHLGCNDSSIMATMELQCWQQCCIAAALPTAISSHLQEQQKE